MNFLKRIYYAIKNKVAPKKPSAEHTPTPIIVTPVVVPDQIETPEHLNKLIQVIDNINNGSASDPDWTYLITVCKLDDDKRSAVEAVVRVQESFWSRYVSVSLKTGVPADVIANIHYKESSGAWDRCLHNGDRVIGNGKKTWQVPAGRGPFLTWEEAAIDALMMKKNIFPQVWTTVEKLKFLQKYNGLGHQKKGLEYTPYLWAYTNLHDETGNYYADGKYSITYPIKSPGCMAMMIVQDERGLI